jgi:hypothetical protein
MKKMKMVLAMVLVITCVIGTTAYATDMPKEDAAPGDDGFDIVRQLTEAEYHPNWNAMPRTGVTTYGHIVWNDEDMPLVSQIAAENRWVMLVGSGFGCMIECDDTFNLGGADSIQVNSVAGRSISYKAIGSHKGVKMMEMESIIRNAERHCVFVVEYYSDGNGVVADYAIFK